MGSALDIKKTEKSLAKAGTEEPFPAVIANRKQRASRIWKYAALFFAALSIGTPLWCGAAAANDDPAVIQIQDASGGPLGTFTQEQLKQQFPMRDLVTETPWTNGVKVHFRGPSLQEMIAKYKIGDKANLEVAAYDNFIVKVTMDEVVEFAPVIAIERACTDADKQSGACAKDQDFKPLSLDDGGPFYIVWPLSKLPKPYVPARNTIWVWFVTSIRPVD